MHTFKTPPQQPISFTHTTATLIPETKRIIAEHKTAEDAIAEVSLSNASFATVLRPLIEAENRLATQVKVLRFYKMVAMEKEMRNASNEAVMLLKDYGIESSMREDLFERVKVVYESTGKEDGLNEEERYYLEETYKGYVQNGLALPIGEKREKFRDLKKRIGDLATKCSQNINEENGGIWFTVDELTGLPTDRIERLKKGGEGSEMEGKLFTSFKKLEYEAVMKYAVHSDTRKRMFIGHENKNLDNKELFAELVALRDEAARLLGYSSHLDAKTQDRMLSADQVNDTLTNLAEQLAPGGREEAKVLLDLKAKDLQERGLMTDGRLYLWDTSYYMRKHKERKFSFNERQVSEYFTLDRTLHGLIAVFEHLLGIQLVPVDIGQKKVFMEEKGDPAEAAVWHEDVEMYAVWDEEARGGGFLGYLYLDVYQRDGKHNHACHANLEPGFYDFDTNIRHYPASALILNYSKPTATKPTLSLHHETVSLFHELGHAVHSLVSKTRFAGFYGTLVSRDFVEIPSKMLENWCWIEDILYDLAHHYTSLNPTFAEAWKAENSHETELPPSKPPRELLRNLIQSRYAGAALTTLRQLHFSTYDFKIHNAPSHDIATTQDLSSLYNSIRKDLTGLNGPEINSPTGDDFSTASGQTRFGHLVRGYDAGYYCYVIATTISKDLFESKFRVDPMSKEMGRLYRDIVLRPGGSMPAMGLLEKFLGRKPDGKALARALGIQDEQQEVEGVRKGVASL